MRFASQKHILRGTFFVRFIDVGCAVAFGQGIATDVGYLNFGAFPLCLDNNLVAFEFDNMALQGLLGWTFNNFASCIKSRIMTRAN
jgi:hypothetical protein